MFFDKNNYINFPRIKYPSVRPQKDEMKNSFKKKALAS